MGSVPEPGVTVADGRPIDFWNVNVPKHLHTADCPPYLKYAIDHERDRESLLLPDAQYHRLEWDEVLTLLRGGGLDKFQRVPSDLRRYLAWMADVEKVEGKGGMHTYILRERLRWTPADLVESDEVKPDFNDESSFRILRNDWPYGIDERIVHLVVWTKAVFPMAPASATTHEGDLTPAARAQIEAFVDERFGQACGPDNVLWFRNWRALKSIHTVEHFHVMLRDADPAFIYKVTGGDVATADKIRQAEG